jgi:hypothetical protein
MDYNDETKTLRINDKFPLNISNEIEKIVFVKYSYFNKKLDNLPQKITHLVFGRMFNKKVDNLPKNLTHLTFEFCFNKKVDNLPKNLTHIIFGVDFNQNIDKLYKNLKYLQIDWYFQNEIMLSKNLKELSLTCNNYLIDNIPEHIEKIYIYFSDYDDKNRKVENLPLTIKEIVIEDEYYKKYIKIPFECILTIKNLNY